MVINPFRPKEQIDPVEEFLLTSATPPTLAELLADAAVRFSGRPAYQQKVDGRWEGITFDQLWRQSRDFGAGLIALGLEKGDRVAIMCENSLPWIIGYLGTVLAGGIGVPLYTELKTPEAEALVKRSGAKILITSTKVLHKLGDHAAGAATVIEVGGVEPKSGQPPRFLRRGRPGWLPFDQIAAGPEHRAQLDQRRVEPDDIASIVFTSGTTGGMKGVMLTHKNLTSNVESIRRSMPLDDKDRIVLVLPLHHAFPFIIFLANLVVGGEMTFENDLLRVRDRLKEVKPTIFLGVPALFDQMYRAIVRRAEAEGRLEMFERGLRVVDVAKRRTGVNLGKLVFREIHQQLGGQLKLVLSGGAALNPDIAKKFFSLGLLVLQGWGMSEASPTVTAQRLMPRKFQFSNYYEEHVGSVGPAVEGVQVELIDVPEKEIYVHLHGQGELVVRGPNVFAGYWQSPEETSQAKAGDWLRTGDLGRIDEEGNIWITGRSKYVIVLESGEKIVPDELEEHFQQSELLWDLTVLPRQHRGKTQVSAVVCPNVDIARTLLKARGEPATDETIRKLVQEEIDRLSKDLAQYKRITEVTLTDTPLPRTAILKVMRAQLPDSFSFDVKRWEQSSQLGIAAAPAEPDQ